MVSFDLRWIACVYIYTYIHGVCGPFGVFGKACWVCANLNLLVGRLVNFQMSGMNVNWGLYICLRRLKKKTGFIIVYDLYRYLYCMYFYARNLKEFTFKVFYWKSEKLKSKLNKNRLYVWMLLSRNVITGKPIFVSVWFFGFSICFSNFSWFS